MKTLKDVLLWAESGYGNKRAIVDLDRGDRWTYADLNARARSVCAGYSAAGLAKGDRIGWLAMSPAADVSAVGLGAKKMGVIPVVMNARASVERIAWMIDNLGVTLLSYTDETRELLERLQARGIPTVKTFLAIDEPADSSHLALADIYREHTGAGEPDVDVAPDDVSHIVYTSGSTGMPKPVMYTEENWIECQRNMAYAWGVYHEDRFINYLPPHFTAWVGVNTVAFVAGASQVCLRFDPGQVAKAIAAEACTHTVTTPTMVRMLLNQFESHPELFADNAMRVGMLGGETITPDVLNAVAAMFPSLRLMGSLGATEGAIMHTGIGNQRMDTDDGRLVGKPLPGITVELRDVDTGAVIEGAGTGELFVRGPIASGIWGDEAATAKNFPDGWWRSGDLLVRDEEGYYSFGGRADNVFKSGAIKISTEDVETVLKAHPQILDAVVVPVPDERYGMVPHAFVRHRNELSSDELESWWRQRDDADAYARPRHWTMMGEAPFPMVTAAKVDRHGLRTRAVREREDAISNHVQPV